MTTGPDQDLRLECHRCGAVLGLDRDERLVARVRPFVIEHGGCDIASYDVDREMRSAFPLSA